MFLTLVVLTAAFLMPKICLAQQKIPTSPSTTAPTKSGKIRSFMDWGKSLVTPTGHEKPALNLTPAPARAANPVGLKPVAGQVSPVSHAAATKTSSILELGPTDNLAEIVAKTRGAVIIDFHASWCGPCKSQGKVLKELEPYAVQNGARIVKIDVDKHAELAKKLNIASLPTLMVIKNGALVESKVGLADRNTIVGYLTAPKQ